MVIEIVEALDAARGAGIVYRHLMPSTLLLTKSGAKVLGFGFRLAVTERGSSTTQVILPSLFQPPFGHLDHEGAELSVRGVMPPRHLTGRAKSPLAITPAP
jgi:hypothetical protein